MSIPNKKPMPPKPPLTLAEIIMRADVETIRAALEARQRIDSLLAERAAAYERIAALEHQVDEIMGAPGLFVFPAPAVAVAPFTASASAAAPVAKPAPAVPAPAPAAPTALAAPESHGTDAAAPQPGRRTHQVLYGAHACLAAGEGRAAHRSRHIGGKCPYDCILSQVGTVKDDATSGSSRAGPRS